jgi:hypothetical protein
MSDTLDLGPIKARLAATTPGQWIWADELGREIPYDNETWVDRGGKLIPTGNDGALGVSGLYIETPIDDDSSEFEAVFYADDENIPEDPNDPNDADWSQWRGLIQATNVADLEFIAAAKGDIEALIAEVERLRILLTAP